MIAELIATPSVSCVHADLDMSNRGVIDQVAEWSESLGFEIEIQSIKNDKYNLIARSRQRQRWPGAVRSHRHGAL